MLDAAGEVLYVGKAKSIKKRIVSYTRPTGHDTRIERVIAAIPSPVLHRVVARPQGADVLVLNTCVVTAEAARKTRKLARRLRRQAPAARLVLDRTAPGPVGAEVPA